MLGASEDEARIKATYAYNAGYNAGMDFDYSSPYEPGTESHRHWEKGYKAGAQWESNVW